MSTSKMAAPLCGLISVATHLGITRNAKDGIKIFELLVCSFVRSFLPSFIIYLFIYLFIYILFVSRNFLRFLVNDTPTQPTTCKRQNLWLPMGSLSKECMRNFDRFYRIFSSIELSFCDFVSSTSDKSNCYTNQ